MSAAAPPPCRLLVLCFLGAGLVAPAAGAAPDRPLRLEVPAGALGDGTTPVSVLVRAAEGEALISDDVVVDASGGTVGLATRVDDTTLRFEWLPPRLARTVRVEVEAVWPGHAATRTTAAVDVRPPALPASVAAGHGPLHLTLPAGLILADAPAVELQLDQPGGGPVTLHVSAGEISAPETVGDGRLRARYLAPTTRVPQILIVGVLDAEGRLLDWATMPLLGVPRLKTDTRPGARVVNRVGDQAFGPMRADRRGRVELDVIVPPSTERIVTETTDRLGNTAEQEVPLTPPRTARTLALCPDSADRVLAITVTREGAPSLEWPIQFTASHGRLEAPENLSPGVSAARWVPPPGLPRGTQVTLSARVPDEAWPTSSCRLAYPGPPPSGLAVRPTRRTWVAGDAEAIAVDVELAWTGDVGREAPVQLTADTGAVVRLVRTGHGRHRAIWSHGADLRGRDHALLTARTRGAGGAELRAQARIELRPAVAARVFLETDDADVRADGVAHATVRARVVDAHGNRAAARLEGSARRGALGPFEPEAGGALAARYTAPQLQGDADDLVVVRDAAGAVARLPLALHGPPPSIAAGARLGLLTNFERILAPTLALEVETRLRFVDERLVLGVELMLYGSRDCERVLVPMPGSPAPRDLRTDLLGLPLLVRLGWEDRVGPVTLRATAGAGLVFVSAAITDQDDVIADQEVAGTVPAFGGWLSAARRLGRHRLTAEAGWLQARIDEPGLVGSIGGLTISAGWTLEL